MPDGTPLSLPIPREKGGCCSYNNLLFRTQPLSKIIRELTDGPLPFIDKAHADPDLNQELRPRKPGWRPIFGQTGGDQRHLENQGVGVGDLFLFFGWFRFAEFTSDGKLHFTGASAGFHTIFGWFQVGQVHKIDKETAKLLPEWTFDHPHVFKPDDFDANNTIYISVDNLDLGRGCLPIPGAGTFTKHTPSLHLTAGLPNKLRSVWSLPGWFYRNGKPVLSYHRNMDRWSLNGQHSVLKSVARGQEFVFDTQYYPEAPSWVESLFKD